MTEIILNGCNGKMGMAVSRLIAERDDCKIVAGVDCFDDFFNTEYFQERFYSNLDCSYSASDVINLSPDAKEEIFLTTADNTIDDLVGCQDILIVKELERR